MIWGCAQLDHTILLNRKKCFVHLKRPSLPRHLPSPPLPDVRVDLRVKEDEKNEGDDAENDEPGPVEVDRVVGVHPELRDVQDHPVLGHVWVKQQRLDTSRWPVDFGVRHGIEQVCRSVDSCVEVSCSQCYKNIFATTATCIMQQYFPSFDLFAPSFLFF